MLNDSSVSTIFVWFLIFSNNRGVLIITEFKDFKEWSISPRIGKSVSIFKMQKGTGDSWFLRRDVCQSARERGNHETNVSAEMPDAASAPSVRVAEENASSKTRVGGGAWFNQSFHVVFAFSSACYYQSGNTSNYWLPQSCLKGSPPSPSLMEITCKTDQFDFHPLSF